MTTSAIYTTHATPTGGRDGESRLDDGSMSAKLAVPKEMGGPGGGQNPEQLFAMGYAACFLGAMKFVASQDKAGPRVPDDAKVHSSVGIGKRDAGGFGLVVELKVEMPGVPKEAVQKLADTAHTEICPYSHATRGNVDVKITVV